jgi:hypothetical protein
MQVHTYAAEADGASPALQLSAACNTAERHAPAMREPFVRVPNVLLGKLLDGGRASAYAAHLLAIKARHGAGFALQETRVGCTYGTGRRGFRQGIARLRDVGAITTAERGSPDTPSRRPQRWRGRPGRPRRPWAAEAMMQILQPGERGWVALPERLLAEDAFVVGMVLTVLLSPRAIRAAEAAARIGVTSRTTIARLVKAAVATKAVVRTEGPRGAILLERPTTVAQATRLSDGARADVSKNVPSRIVPPYREMEDGTKKGRLSPPQPPTPRCARRGGSGREGDGLKIIEALRAEGQPAHVIDDLFGWWLAEGLIWWTWSYSPLGTARALCADLAHTEPRVIAAARGRLRAERRRTMPPVPDILEAVKTIEAQLCRN